VRDADLVIDLIAYANPGLYLRIPLEVFRLNFTENLKIAEACVRHGKRLIQFSTCEVYGRTAASLKNARVADPEDPIHATFSEDTSEYILGPVSKHRWIYACAKQLLERVLHAYGLEQGFNYTIIRPFNFIGPKIDFLPQDDKEGIPRVFSFFMEALFTGTPMKLVNGGVNRRCYTYIDDAIECTYRVVLNQGGVCDRQILNVGSPYNEISIRQMAETMREIYAAEFRDAATPLPEIVSVPGEEFYGEGYDDSDRRIPDIARCAPCWAGSRCGTSATPSKPPCATTSPSTGRTGPAARVLAWVPCPWRLSGPRHRLYCNTLNPLQPATILWGRLAACGRVVLGLPAGSPTPLAFGCGYAAPWGSQSWLQPAFSRRPLSKTPPERRLQARLPAPQKLAETSAARWQVHVIENVFILMPAYNAGATIEKVFARVPLEARRRIRRYVAVNDGSTDDTAAALERLQKEFSNLVVLDHAANRGYGEAEKTLLRYALAERAEVGIVLHSDGQYSPEKIPDLLAPFDRGTADLVQGSRMLGGGASGAGCRSTSTWPTKRSRPSRTGPSA